MFVSLDSPNDLLNGLTRGIRLAFRDCRRTERTHADQKGVIYSFRSSRVSLPVNTKRFLSRAIAGASHEQVWCGRGTRPVETTQRATRP